MAIGKTDFIAAIAARAKLAPAQAEALLDAISEVTAHELATEGSVRVPGLVNVVAKQCSARPGRNLRTGEACMVPAARRIRISPSAPLESKFKQAGGQN